MTTLNFDANSVEPAQPMSVLPKGRYNAEITDSEMKDTASGGGQYLQLEFTIIDGEYAGRKQWARLNLVNPNKTAEDIARRELSAICHAVGVLKVGDSQELHNRPLQIDVTVEKRKDNGEEANRIKGYIPVGQGGPQAFSAPAKTAPAANAKAPPPWAKNKAA